MLKIKDDIDLKILEVDGFIYNDLLKSYVLTYDEKQNTIKVDCETREIYYHLNEQSYRIEIPNIIYDLIESNLVDNE